jgi:hypothetical protein
VWKEEGVEAGREVESRQSPYESDLRPPLPATKNGALALMPRRPRNPDPFLSCISVKLQNKLPIFVLEFK